MPGETANLRDLARRVKQKALEHAEAVLNDEKHEVFTAEIYNMTYQTVLKNAVPQTREIGGDPDNLTPIPIYGNISISRHDGNQKDIQTNQTD